MSGGGSLGLLSALLLVVVANTAPWAAARLFGGRYAWPLDCGATLSDGTQVLGSHKTWRGFLAGAFGCALTARLLGDSFLLGFGFGALSLVADALSSFVKRRLHLAPGTEVLGLDQLPEALLPLLILSNPLGIGLPGSVLVAIVFLSLNLAFMRLRHS
jgi:hypothetical protein